MDLPDLTTEECRAKAAECRAMARDAVQAEHRVMLLHIAETWERISVATRQSLH